MTWTDARIAELARLWGAGVSASGIADVLGDVSRSAVLGKLHRLKLLKSRKAASAPRRYEGPVSTIVRTPPFAFRAGACAEGPPEPPRSPWRETAFAPLDATSPRPWLTRAAGECAFPVGGDGDALLSCCAAVSGGSAYCPTHHRIVFRPVSPAARAADQRRWDRLAQACGDVTLESRNERSAA